jgi:hypothetical protein
MRPLVWSSLDDKEPKELPVPTAVTDITEIAVNINNAGMVVGLLWGKKNSTITKMIVVWQLIEGDPTLVEPLILAEATDSVRVPDLNDAGEVVGSVSYEGQRWSVTCEGLQLTASGPEVLTGTMIDDNGEPKAVSLEPQAINEAGDICGHYGAAEGPFGAFLLLFDGTLIDLPPLESKRYFTRSNCAYDLNDAVDSASIQVVGDVAFFLKRSGMFIDTYQAVWQGGNVTDLEDETAQPDSDLRLVGINRISNHGWLSGWAGDITTPRAAVIVPR